MAQTAFVERAQSQDAVCMRIIEDCRKSLETCNWKLGELASEWVQVTKKTDGELGEKIGFSRKQVQQRRSVWERWGHVKFDAGQRAWQLGLEWSHFRAAVGWDDADECLQWAIDACANVAEMIAWRRAQRGEDLFNGLVADTDVVPDSEVPEEADGEGQRAESKEQMAESRERRAVESQEADRPLEVPQRVEPVKEPKPAKKPGKSRENVRQPRGVDPARFNLLEELDYVMSSLRDLAGPFVAANKVDDYIRAVRSHVDEMNVRKAESGERKAD